MLPSAALADRLQAIRAELPAHTRLLAVSKGHPADQIRALAGLGQRSFGESRLQEATAKQQQLADLVDLDWHFIGRLQANKVRAVLRQFGTIHGLDSLALAQRMARIAAEEGLRPRVLLQVKLRPDPSKGGMAEAELRQNWSELRALAPLQIIGLMTMAPLGFSPPQRAGLFGDCAALASELGLPELSMGMSGDWREAAAAGSTWVRIGTALFGAQADT